MGALGDVAGALAPAAQGISAGQLAGAQEQLQHQQYLDSLGLEKQKAQHAAKEFDLRQKEFEHLKQRDQGAAIDTVLGELSAEANRTPENDLDVVHQAHVRALRDRVAAKRINGDIAGAAWELQHADNHGANNGTLLGLAPAPPGPSSQTDQGGGASAPSAPAAATSAQPATQPTGIPPAFATAIQGLLAGASPALQQGMGLASLVPPVTPDQSAAPAAASTQGAQGFDPSAFLGALKGLTSPPPMSPAAMLSPSAAPPSAATAAQGTASPVAAAPPTALPATPPVAAAPPVRAATPAEPDPYEGLNLLPFERGRMKETSKTIQAADIEQNRQIRPDERYADYNAAQTRSEQRRKDALEEQTKIVAEAFKRTEEANKDKRQEIKDKLTSSEKALDRISAQKVAEIVQTGHASDATLRREQQQQQAKAKLEDQLQGHEEKFLAGVLRSGQVSNQQARVQMISLERNLGVFYQAALNAEQKVSQGTYRNPSGHIQVNLGPLGSVGGGLSVSNSVMTQFGRGLHDTPEARQYIQTLDRIDKFQNRSLTPEPATPDQAHLLEDRIGAGPNNAGEKEWVKALVNGGSAPPPAWAKGLQGSRSFVDAFNALKAEDPFAAYRMAKIFRAMYGGKDLPDGASLYSIEHPYGADQTGQPLPGNNLPPVPTSGPGAPLAQPPPRQPGPPQVIPTPGQGPKPGALRF